MRLSHQKGARTRGGSASRPEAGRFPDDENGRQWCAGGGGGGGGNPPIAGQGEGPGQAAGGGCGIWRLRADEQRGIAVTRTKSGVATGAIGGEGNGVGTSSGGDRRRGA